MNPAATLANLRRRADLLRTLRDFFDKRGFLEVDTPLVADEIIPELHIEPLPLANGQFLQASPELHMKQLVAAGATAIYQITHSFRAGERGKLHNPEFTIVEWYRVGDDMEAGIGFLDQMMQSLMATPPAARTTYAEAFERHAGLNPHTTSLEELASNIAAPSGMDQANRDEWVNLILAQRIETKLGLDRPEIIYHYPASQAALAQMVTTPAGYQVAERFELYYRGVELANGFHELGDAAEQRRRFNEVNAARVADGRPALPLPESLLAALEHGLPDCTGVALGFDRLAMLAIGATSINEVLAFSQSPDE
jgi:elongation factor P--(R)-beta-lysine ligase